jgi:hypothetical protein
VLLHLLAAALGTSRHFAAARYFGRLRGEEDMSRIYEYAPRLVGACHEGKKSLLLPEFGIDLDMRPTYIQPCTGLFDIVNRK